VEFDDPSVAKAGTGTNLLPNPDYQTITYKQGLSNSIHHADTYYSGGNQGIYYFTGTDNGASIWLSVDGMDIWLQEDK
jgi:hypothetical protein